MGWSSRGVAPVATRVGSLPKVEKAFVTWRARKGVDVLANTELKLVAEPDEGGRSSWRGASMLADRADDATQDRIRAKYEKRVASVRKGMGREHDELERDRQSLASRRAEEKLGLVESLFSVLLGSKSARSASRKAASKMKAAAGKRRMRQTAEGSVTESVNEIARLEGELEELAEDLQDEIDAVAEASEREAEQVEIVNVRPIQRDVDIDGFWLVWS